MQFYYDVKSISNNSEDLVCFINILKEQIKCISYASTRSGLIKHNELIVSFVKRYKNIVV